MGSTAATAPLPETDERIAHWQSKDDSALWTLRRAWPWAARPSPPAYPPISSVPSISLARLFEPDASPSPFPSEPVLAAAVHQDALSQPNTVLYLAYGSNMCAKTFLGRRGIRPLSQVNVSAPALDLTFDLPALPYSEPCVANTAPRKLPSKPPLDPPRLPPQIPDHPPIKPPARHGFGQQQQQQQEEDDDEQDCNSGAPRRPPVWNKGLYGVVYEVTRDDYAKILATEGGGASYHDILVPCFPLPARVGVPEKPPIPVPPKPFLAHTLYAPRLPDDDDDSAPDDGNARPPTPTKTTPAPRSSPLDLLKKKLLRPPRRPSSAHAQPSARYLGLLRDGAREHDLPAEYQAYLGALQPYTITTLRQRVGRVVFGVCFVPLLILLVLLSRLFGDERGRSPMWLVAASTVLMNLVWLSYDLVGRPVFGDGERTMDGEGEGVSGVEETISGRKRKSSFASGWRGKREGDDEEKACLLGRSK